MKKAKKAFETCSPGQVKRIVTILTDSIPTNLPMKLTTELTDVTLRSRMEEFWKAEEAKYYQSFFTKFEIVKSIEVQLDWWENGSFGSAYSTFMETVRAKRILPDQDSERFAVFNDYPQQQVSGLRTAVVVQALENVTGEEWSEFVGLSKGVPAGRNSLIQTLNVHYELLKELIGPDGWIVAADAQLEFPQNKFDWSLYPALHKSKLDGKEFALEPYERVGVKKGHFLLYFNRN